MEKLCFQHSVSLFVTMLVILLLLLPRLTLSSSSTYTRPEKFYVNCGTDSNVTYGGRTFIGDMSSGDDDSFSFDNKATDTANNSEPSTSPEIYQTARIFTSHSSYKFQIDSFGPHFVRLHFSAVSSKTELLTARFTLSGASSPSNNHYFKSFTLQNFNETPRVEEFLLMIDSPELKLRFVPDPSSVAFINAIEVFSAPNDLTIPSSDSDVNHLHTVYRLNVGGAKITPENDTLGRSWSQDDNFLYKKDSARNIQSTQMLNYKSATATAFTAPYFVYQTAKTMKNRTSMNVTWSLKVKSYYTHFIRFHFCDVLSNTSQNSDGFYLYVNGQWRVHVKPIGLLTPFYIDVVNVTDGSGLLNVSIGAKDLDKNAGFLNGLEVMEFLTNSDSSDKSSSWVYIIIPCCVAAALVLVLSLLFTVFLKRRRSKNKKKKLDAEAIMWSPSQLYRDSSSNNSPFFSDDSDSPLQLGLKIPFADVLRATNSFDEQRLIGKGGFGDVYRAVLQDGSKAAIKRGKTGSGQGVLEFQTEIQVLSRIRHRHLVSLTGYCEENSEMILVYEFMEKGTLKEHLYGSDDSPSLTWRQRLEICIGAARGLHYLHSGLEEAIIHRDVKSTNILLDENVQAKVADFGLSKLTVRNQDPVGSLSSNVKGTFGYLDPEYMLTHILTEKSDVYAFGVVLLEVLCARPALEHDLANKIVNLAVWAMLHKSKGTVNEIVDPKLTGQIEQDSLRKFMEIAEKCLKNFGEDRPSMADVICELEYVLQLHREAQELQEPLRS
ncbi:unnamed protein product [Microthlaspi erraticum]|uniref:Protein kinase domain-containing protein n=1 Tax=Microthlaspi erraticum TaxID=1685480 RepID=A0A6D2JL91_9BRAS|nr:unnamed protein product [Microthlaspi erraticum]